MRDFKSLGVYYCHGIEMYRKGTKPFMFPDGSSDEQIFRALCAYFGYVPGMNWDGNTCGTFLWYDVYADFDYKGNTITFYNKSGSYEIDKNKFVSYDELNEILNAKL